MSYSPDYYTDISFSGNIRILKIEGQPDIDAECLARQIVEKVIDDGLKSFDEAEIAISRKLEVHAHVVPYPSEANTLPYKDNVICITTKKRA